MDQWAQIQKIFEEALQLSPEQRQDFVERACLDNEDLRREVMSLLEAHEESPSFLEQPVG
jgi:eukaryotic-like serine/threonine-protein kinase